MSAMHQQTKVINVPTKPIFSANWRFVGARANNFWQRSKHSSRNLTNLWKYDIWYLILDWYKI